MNDVYYSTQNHFQQMLDIVPDIICEADVNGTYTWMNKMALHFFGRNAIGKKISDFARYGSDSIKKPPPSLTILNDDTFNRSFQICNWQRRRDGIKRLLSWCYRIVKDETGKVRGIILTGRDITEKNRAEQEKDKAIKALHERNKELKCLYGFSKILEQRDATFEKICTDLMKLMQESWQYPQYACCRVIINDLELKTDNYKASQWVQSKSLVANNVNIGVLEVSYIKKLPICDEGPFLADERNLINSLAENLELVVERRISQQEILKEKEKLEEINITLKTVLSNVEEEKNSIKETVALNIEKNIKPLLHKAYASNDASQIEFSLIENNLNNISSNFHRRLISLRCNLTPTEIEVCKLVNSGYLAKEISEMLGISYTTVTSHKRNIRKKLNLNNTQINLRTYLSEFL